MTDPYAALLALAEREHALVSEGRFEELPALDAERTALVAAMPAKVPPSARPALERAAELQLATTAALRSGMAETRRGLQALGRGREAARAYARTG